MNYGGFLDEQIIEHFTEYAQVLFDYFGDEVNTWITFDSPAQYCIEETAVSFIPVSYLEIEYC